MNVKSRRANRGIALGNALDRRYNVSVGDSRPSRMEALSRMIGSPTIPNTFLDLSAELRIQIYPQLATYPHALFLDNLDPPDWMSTSWQVRQQSTKLLLENNAFHTIVYDYNIRGKPSSPSEFTRVSKWTKRWLRETGCLDEQCIRDLHFRFANMTRFDETWQPGTA